MKIKHLHPTAKAYNTAFVKISTGLGFRVTVCLFRVAFIFHA
jgi:hypothetical protein